MANLDCIQYYWELSNHLDKNKKGRTLSMNFVPTVWLCLKHYERHSAAANQDR